MYRYILKRLLAAIPLTIIISLAAFFLISLSPVDPAESVLRATGIPSPTQEMIEAERVALGLDQPFFTRYFSWLGDVLHLDFGTSYVFHAPVKDLMIPAFMNTLRLALVTAFFVIVISILLGVICAVTEGTFVDKGLRMVMVAVSAMPSYWVAILLMLLLTVKYALLPTSGMEGARSYVLPVTTLSLHYLGFYFRLIRTSMIKNKVEGYVVYERACGLPEPIVTKHILMNSMQTAVSAFCMAIPALLAGTVVIENIFSWPGIGKLCVGAILQRDIPLVQAYILMISVAFVFFNLLSDVINAMMNPRLREVG